MQNLGVVQSEGEAEIWLSQARGAGTSPTRIVSRRHSNATADPRIPHEELLSGAPVGNLMASPSFIQSGSIASVLQLDTNLCLSIVPAKAYLSTIFCIRKSYSRVSQWLLCNYFYILTLHLICISNTFLESASVAAAEVGQGGWWALSQLLTILGCS